MLGMPDALVYFSAREPTRAGSYTSSAVILALVGCLPVIVCGYILMPALLSAQSREVIAEARVYLLIAFASALGQVPLNAMRGRGDFVVWNGLRIFGAFCVIVPLILAWWFHHITAVFVANLNLLIYGLVFAGVVLVTLRFRVPGSLSSGNSVCGSR